MIDSVYFLNAKDLTIVQADNGLWYLEPEWKQIILDNGMVLQKGYKWADIEDVLKLEVEKRNTIDSKKPVIIDWLFNIITTQIEPAMLSEETDYIKQVIEFMKTNHEQ